MTIPELAARNLTHDTVLATHLGVADGLWGKFMGLMGRPSLDPDAGLWLPDSNGIHMMFMRFPIDAVFVGRRDETGSCRVVSVHRGLRAWTGLVPFVRGAHGVLELPVGTVDRTATQVGDTLVLAPLGPSAPVAPAPGDPAAASGPPAQVGSSARFSSSQYTTAMRELAVRPTLRRRAQSASDSGGTLIASWDGRTDLADATDATDARMSHHATG